MAHVPHLLILGPWDGDALALDDVQRHHLERVLRVRPGGPVSYTDGAGTIGEGTLGDRVVVRGDEHRVARPPAVTIAVAAPSSRERARFLVEKLAELGVARIRWLATIHGEGRPPRPDRARAWATAALEQSRGAWTTVVDEGVSAWSDLEPPVLAAVQGGGPAPDGGSPVTVAIGPEGGWAEAEVPLGVGTLDLGPRVLRVETAAVVAAVLVG